MYVPLWKETVVGQVTGRVQFLVVVAVFGRDERLWGKINIVRQNGVLHLRENSRTVMFWINSSATSSR